MHVRKVHVCHPSIDLDSKVYNMVDCDLVARILEMVGLQRECIAKNMSPINRAKGHWRLPGSEVGPMFVVQSVASDIFRFLPFFPFFPFHFQIPFFSLFCFLLFFFRAPIFSVYFRFLPFFCRFLPFHFHWRLF